MKRFNSKKFNQMHITIMGLGKFGGGIGAAMFLAGKGAQITVTDLKGEHELSESISMLKGLGIRYVLGRHEINDFTQADMVVVNPAVPKNSEYIRVARKNGAILQTEIGLFIQQCPAPICGITGSNGKSTTVSMIKSILECTDKTFWIGGNIGGSLLQSLPDMSPEDIVVLELSSFQLEWLGEMKWSPHVAAVLNLTPNHLDRHDSFELYRSAKGNILEYQKSGDKAILVRDDPGSRNFSEFVRGNLVWVGTGHDYYGITIEEGWIVRRLVYEISMIFDTINLSVPGKHNLINAMTAAACAREIGADNNSVSRGLSSFKGLQHRLEFVGEHNGIKFYNDSKATTPESTIAAVKAFDRQVIPILGGYDKGAAFDHMASEIAGSVPRAALIGTTAGLISEALKKEGTGFTIYSSLEEAFHGCIAHAKKGDIVVLSPGCASYDMFTDYENRGEIFKKLVLSYIENPG
ncbi:MAG TPA: UDP-N-acetylmuramoyl-L-alanine--D-glutamate ligase [bacterium]|nr:UDP-N-acetylmuramoyl-L-alanine--D-glutamate ligase [bacterium]